MKTTRHISRIANGLRRWQQQAANAASATVQAELAQRYKAIAQNITYDEADPAAAIHHTAATVRAPSDQVVEDDRTRTALR